mmetsp:Transcript_27086/g.78574  ORF Transcript_27086/g.78574 Transcript_27086/m.78574 type:complete len:349 (-) Transcript_27086:127-1173(-)
MPGGSRARRDIVVDQSAALALGPRPVQEHVLAPATSLGAPPQQGIEEVFRDIRQIVDPASPLMRRWPKHLPGHLLRSRMRRAPCASDWQQQAPGLAALLPAAVGLALRPRLNRRRTRCRQTRGALLQLLMLLLVRLWPLQLPRVMLLLLLLLLELLLQMLLKVLRFHRRRQTSCSRARPGARVRSGRCPARPALPVGWRAMERVQHWRRTDSAPSGAPASASTADGCASRRGIARSCDLLRPHGCLHLHLEDTLAAAACVRERHITTKAREDLLAREGSRPQHLVALQVLVPKREQQDVPFDKVADFGHAIPHGVMLRVRLPCDFAGTEGLPARFGAPAATGADQLDL